MEGRLIAPFSMGIFASRQSGKTVFTKNLLLNQERLIYPPFKKVISVYKTWQDGIFSELQNDNFEIQFVDDLQNFDAMSKQKTQLLLLMILCLKQRKMIKYKLFSHAVIV